MYLQVLSFAALLGLIFLLQSCLCLEELDKTVGWDGNRVGGVAADLIVNGEEGDDAFAKRRGWGKRADLEKLGQSLLEKRRGWGKRGLEDDSMYGDKRRGWGKRGADADTDSDIDQRSRRGWGKRADDAVLNDFQEYEKRRGWGKRSANTLDDPIVSDALADDLSIVEEANKDTIRDWENNLSDEDLVPQEEYFKGKRGLGKRSSGLRAEDLLDEYKNALEKRRGWGKRSALLEEKRRGWGKRGWGKRGWGKRGGSTTMGEADQEESTSCDVLKAQVYFHVYKAVEFEGQRINQCGHEDPLLNPSKQ